MAGALGIQFDGLPACNGCLFRLSQPLQDDGEIAVEITEVGSQCDQFAQGICGGLKLSRFLIESRQLADRLRVIWLVRDCLLQQFNRITWLTKLRCDYPAEVEGVRIMWIGEKQPTVGLFGLNELSRLV